MKKTTKGAIAAGAAAVLLAGGAGTFAAWNASTTGGNGGTVTAGSMSIEETSGSWSWADGTEFNPETERLVPGDKVVYTAEYNIDLVGTNLKAELSPALQGITDGGLAEYLKVEAGEGTETTFEAGNHTAEFTTVIEFKPGTANLDGAGLTADLSGGTVTLDQVLATP